METKKNERNAYGSIALCHFAFKKKITDLSRKSKNQEILSKTYSFCDYSFYSRINFLVNYSKELLIIQKKRTQKLFN